MKKNMQRTQGCFSVKFNNLNVYGGGEDFSANGQLEGLNWTTVDCLPF